MSLILCVILEARFVPFTPLSLSISQPHRVKGKSVKFPMVPFSGGVHGCPGKLFAENAMQYDMPSLSPPFIFRPLAVILSPAYDTAISS